MKAVLIFMLLSLFACKPSSIIKTEYVKESITTICPEDGKCRLTIKNNLSLHTQKDEIGATYPIFQDSNNIVLEFEYKRNEESNTADGGYQELLYFELNRDKIMVDLKDSELEKVNLLFGRLCFCRGQSGYYKITKGHLKITKTSNRNEFLITLSFKTDEVPHIITSLSETFTLNN